MFFHSRQLCQLDLVRSSKSPATYPASNHVASKRAFIVTGLPLLSDDIPYVLCTFRKFVGPEYESRNGETLHDYRNYIRPNFAIFNESFFLQWVLTVYTVQSTANCPFWASKCCEHCTSTSLLRSMANITSAVLLNPHHTFFGHSYTKHQAKHREYPHFFPGENQAKTMLKRITALYPSLLR